LLGFTAKFVRPLSDGAKGDRREVSLISKNISDTVCSGFSVGSYQGAWNALDVIGKWRETGVAPDKVVISNRVAGVVNRTHPICP
jgi:hypothetical protein